MKVKLTPPQIDMYDCKEPYPLFVAGFGTGKSYILLICAVRDLTQYKGADIAIYSPTYDLNRLNLEPRLLEILDSLKMRYTHNKSTAIIEVHGYGKFIFRSLDNPAKIIAYEVFRSHVDEIDTLPLAKAQDCWHKIIARNRQKVYVNGCMSSNRVSAYSTPEGYRFTYKMWGQSKRKGYVYFRAATTSNPHLPEDYVDRLIETYPPNLVKAYVEGIWTNLTSGTIYSNFDRKDNDSLREWDGLEPVFIGIDFNVGKMSAVIHVLEKGQPVAVDEITNAFDTPEMIELIKARYTKCTIRVYPDASGGSRKSVDASKTDIALLQQAKFKVIAPRKNPPVKDRILAMNNALRNSKDERIYKVNISKCPNYADCLEQQVWNDNGEPDKTHDLDHLPDGAGYYIHQAFPVIKPAAVHLRYTI